MRFEINLFHFALARMMYVLFGVYFRIWKPEVAIEMAVDTEAACCRLNLLLRWNPAHYLDFVVCVPIQWKKFQGTLTDYFTVRAVSYGKTRQWKYPNKMRNRVRIRKVDVDG